VDPPASISTRAWDDARPRSERFADVPSAKRICEHLGLPWAKVRELAFMAPASQRIALGHALNDQQGNWLTPEYSDFVLALIARRLGARTLTPRQYRVETTAMLRADRARRLHGGQLRLPTEDQISAVAGDWDRALAHAGLAERPRGGGNRPRTRSATVVEVLERCFERYGTEPTSAELMDFVRGNRIPLAAKSGRNWASYVEEWKAGRRARGLPVPDGPPPTDERWDYSQDIGAALPGERRRRSWDDFDELVEWVMRYLAQLRPGDRSNERGYTDWAAEQHGAPWPSAFDAHGSWTVVREAAQLRFGQELAAEWPATAHPAAGTAQENGRTGPVALRRRTDTAEAAGRRAERAAAQRLRRATQLRRVPPGERRGRGRKSTVSLAEMVTAGLLRADETLIGARHERRWRASFNPQTGAVDVEGEGHFVSLTAAAVHCLGGGTANGWDFWGVERDGQLVRLAKLRQRR